MKYRAGFVSNSSSTSFYCNICNETFAGHDGEYGFQTIDCGGCGHTFCGDHFSDLEFDAETCSSCHMLEKCREEGLEQGDPCLGMDIRNSSDYDDIEETQLPGCPICSLQKVPEWEKYRFALKHFGISDKELESIIRSKCGSYGALCSMLRNE